jgi:hypothetical protein
VTTQLTIQYHFEPAILGGNKLETSEEQNITINYKQKNKKQLQLHTVKNLQTKAISNKH